MNPSHTLLLKSVSWHFVAEAYHLRNIEIKTIYHEKRRSCQDFLSFLLILLLTFFISLETFSLIPSSSRVHDSVDLFLVRSSYRWAGAEQWMGRGCNAQKTFLSFFPTFSLLDQCHAKPTVDGMKFVNFTCLKIEQNHMSSCSSPILTYESILGFS